MIGACLKGFLRFAFHNRPVNPVTSLVNMCSQVLAHFIAYVILASCAALPTYTPGLLPSGFRYGLVVLYVSKAIALAAAILCPGIPRTLSDRSFVLLCFGSAVYTARETYGKQYFFWRCGDGIQPTLLFRVRTKCCRSSR